MGFGLISSTSQRVKLFVGHPRYGTSAHTTILPLHTVLLTALNIIQVFGWNLALLGQHILLQGKVCSHMCKQPGLGSIILLRGARLVKGGRCCCLLVLVCSWVCLALCISCLVLHVLRAGGVHHCQLQCNARVAGPAIEWRLLLYKNMCAVLFVALILSNAQPVAHGTCCVTAQSPLFGAPQEASSVSQPFEALTAGTFISSMGTLQKKNRHAVQKCTDPASLPGCVRPCTC